MIDRSTSTVDQTTVETLSQVGLKDWANTIRELSRAMLTDVTLRHAELVFKVDQLPATRGGAGGRTTHRMPTLNIMAAPTFLFQSSCNFRIWLSGIAIIHKSKPILTPALAQARVLLSMQDS